MIRYILTHFILTNLLHGLWNPEVQCRIYKGPAIIRILSRVNPIPRIAIYFFKIHSYFILMLLNILFHAPIED